MKWFKHDSDASNDAKLRKLRHKYGAEGYAIYWYCLELIARNVDEHNLTFELEHDADLIAEDFRMSSEVVQEMMAYMVNLGLFESSHGVITCMKMLSRTDEYTRKLIAMKRQEEPCCDYSGHTPDTLRTKSELIEEKRREETRAEETKPARRSRAAVIKPEDVTQEVWDDYKQLRKTKRAPITQTSLDGLRREASKAGMSVQQAMAYCCAKGWQGFDATWVEKQGRQGKDAQQRAWLNKLTGRDGDAINATARLVG